MGGVRKAELATYFPGLFILLYRDKATWFAILDKFLVVHPSATFNIISSQKRYDGHCAAQSPFPISRQLLSCGTAHARRSSKLPSAPSRSQPTNPAQPAQTPCRPCRSSLTATTTCPKRCTHCPCPLPHRMAAALRHRMHLVRVALWGQTLALHV